MFVVDFPQFADANVTGGVTKATSYRAETGSDPGGLLGPAELGEAILVDPEVVGDLVNDGHPDLLLQQLWIVAELVFQR
jgi:hypothetical protein